MGFAQERAALAVKLPPGVKHVLQCLAFRACGTCGHARPSVPLLALDTGMSERAVRDALVELREHTELVKVWAYSKGGRGVTTEYVVMPGLARLSPPDCADWGKHTNTLRHMQGIARAESAKPGKIGSETLRQTSYHPSEHTHPSGEAPAKAAGSPPIGEPPAGGRSATGPDGPAVEPPPESPLSDPPPRAPQTPAEVAAYVKAISARLHLRTPPQTKPGSHRGP